MITSPTKTYRHDQYVVNKPPMSGPTATATAPPTATIPYAFGRSPLVKFDATSATIAGSTSAAPTPSRNDQPNISTARLGDNAVVSDPAA